MQKCVCHHQEDIEACKLVHMVGDANSNPNELLVSLATLFVTSHLFFGCLSFLVVVTGCVETDVMI